VLLDLKALRVLLDLRELKVFRVVKALKELKVSLGLDLKAPKVFKV
jgi:hypothetical protein